MKTNFLFVLITFCSSSSMDFHIKSTGKKKGKITHSAFGHVFIWDSLPSFALTQFLKSSVFDQLLGLSYTTFKLNHFF